MSIVFIGHPEHGMTISKICQEYDPTMQHVLAVTQLSLEQVQYIKDYADALIASPCSLPE